MVYKKQPKILVITFFLKEILWDVWTELKNPSQELGLVEGVMRNKESKSKSMKERYLVS
jgi:hypothetical protein